MAGVPEGLKAGSSYGFGTDIVFVVYLVGDIVNGRE
jgi:hypothetical protein